MGKIKKGISLIVLIITVIVMIIIAGVIILSLTSSNIIEKANESVFKTNIRGYQEELKLWISNQEMKNSDNFDKEKVNKEGESIKEVISSMEDEDLNKFAIKKGKLIYLEGMTEAEKRWSIELGLNTTELEPEPEEPTTPYKLAIAAVSESTPVTPHTVHSTIDGQNPNYNNPVIPAGFHAVNTDDANWNNVSTDWDNGLVIQDNYGNQFVWVPIDGTNVTYEKWCTTNVAFNNANISSDIFPEGLDETTLANAYKGFYIGRYEAAFDYNGGNFRVKSAKSTSCMTTSWTKSMETDGYLWNRVSYTLAKEYSEAMDGSGTQGYYGYDYDTTKIGTNLVTGTQWDTVLKWISATTTNYTGKSVTDSRTWGNYINSIEPANITGFGVLQISGYSESWKAKNIYDIAGNVFEWNNEKYSSNVVYRGGSYSYGGSLYPAAIRTTESTIVSYARIGFRVALYVK